MTAQNLAHREYQKGRVSARWQGMVAWEEEVKTPLPSWGHGGKRGLGHVGACLPYDRVTGQPTTYMIMCK